MKSKRILSLLAVAALATTILVGCGDKADPNALKDGSYTEKGTADDRGNTPEITIEVKDGKIATVKYDEVSADGVGKTTNEEYNKKMTDAGMEHNPATGFPKLEASLVEKQDVAAVEAVTGVTNSSDSFKELATKVLEQAK
ncbi:MAG: FMN-binding protein [Terrisporobacter sp.]